MPTNGGGPVDVVDEANDAGGWYAEEREEDSSHPEHVQLQPLVRNLHGDDDNYHNNNSVNTFRSSIFSSMDSWAS